MAIKGSQNWLQKWPNGVAEMLASTFFFALMNLCVKKLQGIPTHELVFFRALGVLLLSGGMLWYLRIPAWGNHKRYLILRGFYGSLGLSCYFWTLKQMPLASAVTIQYLSPIFSTLLAVWMLKEIPKRVQWFCFLLSFAGVMLIKGFDPRIAWLPLGAGILAAVFSALAYNYVRRLKDHDHPLVAVFYFPVVTLVLVTPYTLTHWVSPQGMDWLYLGLIGLFTHFAQYYLTRALQAQKMALVSQLNYVGVVYALLMGYYLFGESVPPLAVFGLLLVVAGVVLGSWLGQQSPPPSAGNSEHMPTSERISPLKGPL
ncbi:MAG: DMT family transporter [Candidatus Sericytochromatia bacterium]